MTAEHTRHPVELYYIAIVTAFFNYALGSINALMVLYLTTRLHTAEAPAYAIFAAFNALVFTLPIVGGFLASKYSYKLAVCVGTVFCLVAVLMLSTFGLTTFYLGLGLFAVGYGLALPALFSLPGLFYERKDDKRASGMTLFYIIMNIGFLAAGFVGGYLSQHVSYRAAFQVAALSLLVCLFVMLSLYKRITPLAVHEHPNKKTYSPLKVILLFTVTLLIGFPFSCLFIKDNSYANVIMWLAVGLSILVVLVLAFKQTNPLVKKRLYAFLVLEVIGLFFWITYMLEPSVVTLFIEHNVNRHVFGHLIPAASYYSLNSVFVILLGFFFSYLWKVLASKGKLPSIPSKFSLAIIIMGLGSIVLFAGIHFSGSEHYSSTAWVVLAYVFFSVAELFIGPIGLAMVARLAPKGQVGLLMGIFNLFVGFSAILAGYVGSATSIPEHASLSVTNVVYAHTFLVLGLVTVVLGLLSATLIPMTKRLISN